MTKKFLVGSMAVWLFAGCGSAGTTDSAGDASVVPDAGGSETQGDDAVVTPDGTPSESGGCSVDADCASLLASVTPTPAGCAEAYCNKATTACGLRAADVDGDGYRTAQCDVPGFSAFEKGNDCDDNDKSFFPGKGRNCSAKSDGSKITWPGGAPQGACKFGTETCGSDGKTGACSGAVAPAAEPDCASDLDTTCVGTADSKLCGCKLGASQDCYDGMPATSLGVGPCKKGTQTCIRSTTDPTKTVWGACTGEVVPAAADTCTAVGNDETCNGTPNEKCGCIAGKTQKCGTCMDGTQTCSAAGTWGTCTGARTDVGTSCGKCGGTVKCDGTCTIATPGNYGTGCGSCGGTINCAGACTVATPGNYGAGCGSCGGVINCSGACTVNTPANFGAGCGSCGGTINCSGACSVGTPGNFGAGCGSCGGTVNCSGACSVGTPSNYGASCGSCGGKVNCSGTCSVSTPTNYGQSCGAGYCTGGTFNCSGACTQPALTYNEVGGSPFLESFSCCFINYNKSFGTSCDPGHYFDDCWVEQVSGGGTCQIISKGGGTNCSCTANFHNNGTEGAQCKIHIRERTCP